MSETQIIEADLTWIDDRFERGVRITTGADGMIASVDRGGPAPTLRLEDRAVVPGLVNAHSHAFQRGLRGRGETFPAGAGSFWTWREAMYELVEGLDEQRMYALSRQAFGEMLAAGITTVGEFHYLHHDGSGDGHAFDEVVLRAGADAGIRIVLIQVCYRRGGFEAELSGGQHRFATHSLEAYWQQVDRLSTLIDRRHQHLGACAHSIRAVPIEEIALLYEEACRRTLPFHMHVEEQPLEIEQCVEHHGQTPLALLAERLPLAPNFTAVHCTHSAEADLSDFLESGANICICPLTEANLGDGLPRLPRMIRCGGAVSLGSDSNARISMTEEMRWLEYGQRLALQSRGVCRDGSGAVGPWLLRCATRHGARALGLRAGRIEPGCLADLTAIDLHHPSLAGWTPETLVDAWILGTGNGAVAATCVGGRWSEQAIASGQKR
ncbi:MAG: formimidoylglutamate deiminase [Planctomycetota bacterium]|jgi:formimidoylglutamate deiminase